MFKILTQETGYWHKAIHYEYNDQRAIFIFPLEESFSSAGKRLEIILGLECPKENESGFSAIFPSLKTRRIKRTPSVSRKKKVVIKKELTND